MTQQFFKRLRQFFIPMQLMRFVAATLMLLPLTALQAHEYYADGFMIIHPWSDPTQPGEVDAPDYDGLDNVTQGDRLIKAFSPLAERIEFRAGDGPSAPVLNELPFGTGDANAFGPGKPHLLLRGLKLPFENGRSYLLMLEFERAGKIVVGISVGAH
jgi:copper(I)-binding protein